MRGMNGLGGGGAGVTQEDPRPRGGPRGSVLAQILGWPLLPTQCSAPPTPPQGSLPLENLSPSQPLTALSSLAALLGELRTPNSSPGPLRCPSAPDTGEQKKDEVGFMEVSRTLSLFQFSSMQFISI